MIATGTIQRTFDRALGDARHRPTVGMEGAKHLMDCGEDQVLELIETGEISHAWNIGLGADRREVRILRTAIDRYLQLPAGARAKSELSEQAVRSLLLPPAHRKPFLTNPEIQRSLNCVSAHVLNLVEAGELELQVGTGYRTGPTGTALVTVQSFERFLQNRRMQ
jgi:hypothetical protein